MTIAFHGAVAVQAAMPEAQVLERIGFDQRLGATLPFDPPFIDESGARAPLSAFFGRRPVVLALGYYGCPNVCSTLREALVQNLRRLELQAGVDYDVVAVSIDPRESPALAMSARAAAQGTGESPLPGWHFLTGDEHAIAALASSIGFRYAYDESQRQYAHPVGVVIVTPAGAVARYFFGVDYPPAQLQQSLLDANRGQVGSPVIALLMRCLHFDPAISASSAGVANAARIVGLVTVLLLAGTAFTLERRRRRRRFPSAPA